MTPTETRLIPVLQIRAGDVFERHGCTRIATSDAHRLGQGSVVVGIEGGECYFPLNAEIYVTRLAGRRTSWSATA
ncbi:hypothetical protein ACFQ8W_00165 [Streptomyces sp. NPDC056508]|uniref:hypothetical protein n=1 Tax=Streptomyces sp. NPDC056508 TaxID=3345845 RepID=UPI003695830E